MKQFPISKTVTQLACFNIHWITVPGAGARCRAAGSGPRQGSFTAGVLLLTDEDLESPSSMEDASTPASRIQAEPSWISPRTEISEIVATGALGMRHSMQ